jgi:RNA polymerase sigma-70 factor (ECF subfamily)
MGSIIRKPGKEASVYLRGRKPMEAVLEQVLPKAEAVENVTTALADFDEVVRENQRRIFRFFLLTFRDESVADDLTQECFIRAFTNRNSFRGDAKVSTWLLRIAMNLATDQQRNRRLAFWKSLMTLESDDETRVDVVSKVAVSARIEEGLLANEKLKQVWHAVSLLPMRQRQLFVLRFVDEFSIAEIVEATGLRPGTVKAHLHKAVNTVRKRVQAR